MLLDVGYLLTLATSFHYYVWLVNWIASAKYQGVVYQDKSSVCVCVYKWRQV